jgi:hypothetical protein
MPKQGQLNTHEDRLPNREPQAPFSISREEADKSSAVGRNDVPYNDGSSSSQMRGSGRGTDGRGEDHD